MKITIHRGADQIGGSVTEYEFQGFRLFVDFGEALPGSPSFGQTIEIDGLTKGDTSKSLLLVTHYHADHIGMITQLPSELPLFMGKTAKEIALAQAEHKRFVNEHAAAMVPRIKSAQTFTPGEAFEFGPFKIMPIAIDHSAFDSYAFAIEADGLKVFHTGDFRTHGFRSRKLPLLIEKYVGHAHYVVCEATNVARPDVTNRTEHDLQRLFIESFKKNESNIVYCASTNIDRLFSLYHAAVRAGRPFYVDAHQRKIMKIVAGRDSVWGKSKLYCFVPGHEPTALQREGDDFKFKEEFRKQLSDRGYVIVARATERFDRLVAKLPGDKKIYLSMWDGYINPENESYSPSLAKSVGNNYSYLHTSGHCDMAGLEQLFSLLNPRAIIPIHTDSPREFANRFADNWPVILLPDGHPFEPIIEHGLDSITLEAIARCEQPKELTVIDNPRNLNWFGCEKRTIGEFASVSAARQALDFTTFAPSRIQAYAITAEEDFDIISCQVFNPDHSLRSKFPDDQKSTATYSAGDIALAYINMDFYEAIIPCEIIGPINETYLRNWFDEDPLKIHDSYEDFAAELSDFTWNSIIIRPLVRLTDGAHPIPELTDIPTIHLFPLIPD